MPDEQESPVVEESAGGDPVEAVAGEAVEEVEAPGLVDRAMSALGMGDSPADPEPEPAVEAAPAAPPHPSKIQSKNAEIKRRRKYGQ